MECAGPSAILGEFLPTKTTGTLRAGSRRDSCMAYTDEMLADDSAAGRKGDPAAGSVAPDTEVQGDDCSEDPTFRDLAAEQSRPALLDSDSYQRPRAGALDRPFAAMRPDQTKVHDALEDLREIVGERVLREIRKFQERVDAQFQVLQERVEGQTNALRMYVDAQVATLREVMNVRLDALRAEMTSEMTAVRAEINSLRRENRLLLGLIMLLVTLGLIDRSSDRSTVPPSTPNTVAVPQTLPEANSGLAATPESAASSTPATQATETASPDAVSASQPDP